MANIDIFNGDADGLCSLLQLRLAEPRDSRLVTGVKRDIALVEKASIEAGDDVVALDISFDKNRVGVLEALSIGAKIFYVDHHFSGDVPQHGNLRAIINPASDVCTSILVNKHLQGRYCEWAITGAYGDNLERSAAVLAKGVGLAEDSLRQLADLGIYLNYNAYGADLEDLYFAPAALFETLRHYSSPLDFMLEERATYSCLEAGYRQDMSAAAALKAVVETDIVAVFVLPGERWARRVSGVYSNQLVNTYPARAHAVLTERGDGSYLVSIRAPLNNRMGADEVARQFVGGGGRKAAAGIDRLPAAELGRFVDVLTDFYRS